MLEINFMKQELFSKKGQKTFENEIKFMKQELLSKKGQKPFENQHLHNNPVQNEANSIWSIVFDSIVIILSVILPMT